MVLLCAFLLCVAVQCVFAAFFTNRLWGLASYETASETPPVSVVICAKDEAANLQEYLPAVLQQAYAGSYEVIVVNDASTDNTEEILRALARRFTHLSYVTIPANESKGKKNALRNGATAAHNELLLLTDADCRPAGEHWLQLMTAPLSHGKDIVAGFGGYYETEAEGRLNAFVQWETLHTFIQYSAYALAGLPYMAVGRNLACKKQVLLDAMQHPLWGKLPSGDDDMLVCIAGTASNVGIVAKPDAHTLSLARPTWKEWAHQKRRHLSTGKYYRNPAKLMLGTYAATHAGMWLAFFLLLFSPWWYLALALCSLRCILIYTTWRTAAGMLDKQISLISWWPADIGWMIYNFAFLPYITWKNKTNWK